MMPILYSIKTIASLARATLSLFVTYSALSSYLYFKHVLSPEAIFLCAGVFFLSCAASALNQVQERQCDGLMERTRNRPLPANRLAPWQAVMFSIVTGSLGLGMLLLGTNPIAAILGSVAILVYNGIYTPMKKKTSLTLFPGAIAGALPVLIGCAAAIGSINVRAIYIALFVFLWQMPHFLLLLYRYKEDYTRAGISMLLSNVSSQRLKIIICIWILAASGVTSLFSLIGIIRSMPLLAIIAALNIYLIIEVYRSLRRKEEIFSTRALYIYQVIIFALLIVQGLI
jgi:heme o synthase